MGTELLAYCRDYGIKSITLPLALCFILACSLFGLLFLPLCAVAFGTVSYDAWAAVAADILSGVPLRAEAVLCFIIITPAFFVVAVQGMKISEMMIKLLCSNSLSGKETFTRCQLSMIFMLAAAVAAVTFILK